MQQPVIVQPAPVIYEQPAVVAQAPVAYAPAPAEAAFQTVEAQPPVQEYAAQQPVETYAPAQPAPAISAPSMPQYAPAMPQAQQEMPMQNAPQAASVVSGTSEMQEIVEPSAPVQPYPATVERAVVTANPQAAGAAAQPLQPQQPVAVAQAPAGPATKTEADASASKSQPSDDPEDALARDMNAGGEAFFNGNYSQARGYFLRAGEQFPDNIDAKLASAIADFALGQYDMPALLIRDVVSSNPMIVHAEFDLRNQYGQKDDLTRHTDALVKHVKEHADNADARLVLGFIQYFSGQREAAAATFKELLKKSPNDAAAKAFLNPPSIPQAPTTQPSAQPTTRPAAQPTTRPAGLPVATTAPTSTNR